MPHGSHLGMNLISTVKAALPNATGSHCTVSSLTETWISHIILIFKITTDFFFCRLPRIPELAEILANDLNDVSAN